MRYLHSLPASATFRAKGVSGYPLGPLQQKRVEVDYMDVATGHDTFQISRKVTRIYYVLDGVGYFTIQNQRLAVGPGVLVEVPPRVEYSYSGKMKMLVFSTPRWFCGNDTATRWNPDVVNVALAGPIARDNWLRRIGGMRVFGKSPTSAFMILNGRFWCALPSWVTSLRPVHWYGTVLHRITLLRHNRAQALATFFLRNRAELELMSRLVSCMPRNRGVNVAVLGCSSGAEAYSIAWTVKNVRRDLPFRMQAVDVSPEAVELAKRGIYSNEISPVTGTTVLERLSAAEIEDIFERKPAGLSVRPWIREGIEWGVADVRDAAALDAMGPQDIVVANNFLCHMDPSMAENCLRNVARLVRPGGHIFVGGVDLEIRKRIARELGWTPVPELLEEIHDGDPCVRGQWPCHYAGLEPLDKRRKDWKFRYAVAFQVPASPSAERGRPSIGGDSAREPTETGLSKLSL